MTTTVTDSSAVRGPGLNRVIGPKLLLFLVIGDMLGTGIYALTGDVAGRVGGAAWLAFGGAFIVAMFTATSYLELSASIRTLPAPRSTRNARSTAAS